MWSAFYTGKSEQALVAIVIGGHWLSKFRELLESTWLSENWYEFGEESSVWVSAVSLIGTVALVKSFHLSEPVFSTQNGNNSIFPIYISEFLRKWNAPISMQNNFVSYKFLCSNGEVGIMLSSDISKDF